MINRRDFLKYGALAGAVAGGLSALGPPLTVLPGPTEVEAKSDSVSQDEFLENGKFKIDIQGCPTASTNIQSVQVEDLIVDVLETTPPESNYRTYAPGDAHYGRATFRARVLRDNKELLQWFEDAAAGKNIRKNISIVLLNKKGNEARRYNLMECFPIKYDPGDYDTSSTVQTETLTVKVSRIELV